MVLNLPPATCLLDAPDSPGLVMLAGWMRGDQGAAGLGYKRPRHCGQACAAARNHTCRTPGGIKPHAVQQTARRLPSTPAPWLHDTVVQQAATRRAGTSQGWCRESATEMVGCPPSPPARHRITRLFSRRERRLVQGERDRDAVLGGQRAPAQLCSGPGPTVRCPQQPADSSGGGLQALPQAGRRPRPQVCWHTRNHRTGTRQVAICSGRNGVCVVFTACQLRLQGGAVSGWACATACTEVCSTKLWAACDGAHGVVTLAEELGAVHLDMQNADAADPAALGAPWKLIKDGAWQGNLCSSWQGRPCCRWCEQVGGV